MANWRVAEPRIALFCKCGAQWHGRYIKSAAGIIENHRERCGGPIPAQTYELLGHQIIWPGHWTPAERAAARSASLRQYDRVAP